MGCTTSPCEATDPAELWQTFKGKEDYAKFGGKEQGNGSWREVEC